MKTQEIWITDTFEGFHKYENAPEEVAFLKNLHRHMFKVHASIEVFEDDREIEFFMAKKVLKQIITETCSAKPFLGSCEQISDWILDGLVKEYETHRRYSVEVSEDGENSAVTYFEPDPILIPSVWMTDERSNINSSSWSN